jgi:hypothetical protein
MRGWKDAGPIPAGDGGMQGLADAGNGEHVAGDRRYM